MSWVDLTQLHCFETHEIIESSLSLSLPTAPTLADICVPINVCHMTLAQPQCSIHSEYESNAAEFYAVSLSLLEFLNSCS